MAARCGLFADAAGIGTACSSSTCCRGEGLLRLCPSHRPSGPLRRVSFCGADLSLLPCADDAQPGVGLGDGAGGAHGGGASCRRRLACVLHPACRDTASPCPSRWSAGLLPAIIATSLVFLPAEGIAAARGCRQDAGGPLVPAGCRRSIGVGRMPAVQCCRIIGVKDIFTR